MSLATAASTAPDNASRPAARSHTGPARPGGPTAGFAQLLRGQSEEADDALAADPTTAEAAPAEGSADAADEAPDSPAQRGPRRPGSPLPEAADALVLPPPWLRRGLAEAGHAAAAGRDAAARLSAASRQAHQGSAADAAAADTDELPTRLAARTRLAEGPAGGGSEINAAFEAAQARALAEPAPEIHVQEGSLPSLQAGADTPTLAASAPDTPAPAAPEARATLTPAPGTPAFTEAMSVQLSTWLEEGVQHAWLELNPADLGPIDVRIALGDGAARIELGAEVASTRAALAEALPQLAQALGDAGLSLSGGGVSDFGGGSGAPAGDDARAAASAQALAQAFGRQATLPDVPAAEAGGRRPAAVRSLLDLYA
jgi:flagellar hook-length control protein FliK